VDPYRRGTLRDEGRDGEARMLLWLGLVVAVVPFAALVVAGRAAPGELGAAGAVAALALAGLRR
jgi:hypothetical protein